MNSLRAAPSIVLVATVTTVACVLAAIPLAAFGDDAPATPAPSAQVAELVEVREQVEAINEEATEEAPPAVGSRCDATLDVEGLGDTCVARDGLLRVEQADGRSHTIHGLDAPPVGAASYAPSSLAALNGASVADISCAAAGSQQYVLVYARPGDVASRYSTIAPLLRTETYKVSAFIDGESRSVDPSAGRRLPMRCDAGGEPVVLQATLSELSAGTATFSSIVDGLRGLGYQFNGDQGGTERYVVYWDAPSPTGAAGTGHVFTSDASAGAGNQNNKGGLYSVEYRFDQGGGVPHWEVLVHEVLHTMGAVVGAAPHSTPAGHCTDGLDVMCYADSSSSGYVTTACATKVLDCNRDDYFNPAPPAGSYLASHWNAAASYNAWLVPHAGSPTASAVGGLQQTGASASAIGLAWSPAAGAERYVVSIREPGGAWRVATQTTRTAAAIGDLRPATTYDVGVATMDAAGRTGTPSQAAMATGTVADTRAPGRPGRISVRQRPGKVTFRWSDAGDDVGVTRFQLNRVTRTLRGRSTRGAGTTSDTTFTLSTRRLRQGAMYQFEVIAFDAAGNASPARFVRMRVMRDRARPTKVLALRAKQPTRSSVVLTWRASRDNVGVTSYVVSQRVGRRWVQLGTTTAGRRAIRVNRLRPRSTYQFRVQARDAANNRSAPGLVRARTR